jgi:hypothetical protein
MLRSDGTLPAGEHLASWREFEAQFGTGARRTNLMAGLLAVLVELQRVGCSRAWIDGSFVTAKLDPNDFDMCWDEAGVDLAALDPAFFDFANHRAGQKARYGGEMFPAGGIADTMGTTYREFFQQKFGVAKGIIQIDL